jgi:TonB family protein
VVAALAWAPLPSPAAGPEVPAELTPAERARRDADSVFRWITIHADNPRKGTGSAAPADARPAVAGSRRKPTAAAPSRPNSSVQSAGATPANSTVASAAPTPTVGAPAELAQPPATASDAASVPSSIRDADASSKSPQLPREASAVPVAFAATGTAAASEPQADEPLALMARIDPQFPAALLRSMRAGKVQLRFTVQPDGSVADATVVNSSNSRLNPAALAAVAQWRFAPLRKSQSAIVDLGFDLN